MREGGTRQEKTERDPNDTKDGRDEKDTKDEKDTRNPKDQDDRYVVLVLWIVVVALVVWVVSVVFVLCVLGVVSALPRYFSLVLSVTAASTSEAFSSVASISIRSMTFPFPLTFFQKW